MIRLFRVSVPTSAALLAVSEMLLIPLCYMAAMQWEFGDILGFYLNYESGAIRWLLASGVTFTGLYLMDVYRHAQMASVASFIRSLSLALGVSFLLQAVFSYFGLELQMPRLSMLLGSAICLLVLPLWRRLLIQQILQITAERILFLGGDPFCHAIETYVCENKGLNMHCAGYLTDGEIEPKMEDRVVGRIRDLRKVFRDIRPNRLVVSARCDEVKRVLPEVIYLRQGGIQVESSREMYESLFERAAFTGEDDPWSLALGSRTPPAPGLAEIVRSGFSWTLACLLLVAAAPVCASIIWWAGRRVSEGIVEREQVAGKNGRPFSRRRLRRTNRRGWSGLADAWLQLQNVIQGEMALVGPQADLTEVQRTLAQRIPLYGRRLNLRPGITGWAQVHQTSDEVQETLIKLEYDLYYEKNQSLLMDLYILLQSMKLT